MDALDQINEFKRFIEENYLDNLLENSRKGKRFLEIDFKLLSRFNIELGDLILELPEETIKACKMAIEQFDIPNKDFQVMIKNLPESSKRTIASKRSVDLKNLLSFEGVIRAKSAILNRSHIIKFECPSCGNLINVIQDEKKKKEPTRCGCGRKGKFRLLHKEKVDIQKIELEELPDNVKGTAQPQRLKIILKDFLVDPNNEPKFNPGAKVLINGILEELPIALRTGGESIDSDYILDAVYMENIEDEEIDLNITPEEQEQIDKIASDEHAIKYLTESLIPSIYGHDKIKEGILIQLVGGVRKKINDGTVKRGDIHILMIGDPGSGKSAMLQRIEKVVPQARVANGKGASGVGLTAAVTRDDFIGWTFQAGTLVLAHKSLAIIDEFDKMSSEDRDQIHEALEQQTVTVAKAGVQARLSCECSLLAGANPKYGRFTEESGPIAQQINLPPTIINRFDLMFPVKDIPEADKDKKLADKILSVHQSNGDQKATIETPLIRKYIHLAKKLKPSFTDAANNELTNYYLKIRGKYSSSNGAKTVPISARQLEGLIRLSEAYAKLRLSNEVNRKDALRAIDLLNYCLKQVAFDDKTGEIDIDMITTGVKTSERANIVTIKELIETLEKEKGKIIQIEDLMEAAKKANLEEDEVETAINQLKTKGDIYEPRKGSITRMT